MKKADNFDASKWLVENKITFQSRLNENINFPEMEDEFRGAMETGDQTKEEYLQDIINTPSSQVDLSGYYEVENAIEQGDYSKEQAIKLMKAWAKEKLGSRLNENEEFDNDFPSLDYNTITNFIKSKGYEINGDYYDGGFDVNNGEYFVGVFDDHIAVTDNDGQVKDIPFTQSRLNKITTQSRLNENQINNKYVVKDDELSDKYGDFYAIDTDKALDYLKQFNNEDVDAEVFIDDDEGWGEFVQYIDDVEQMSDAELEDAMRKEMSMYFFSDEDSI